MWGGGYLKTCRKGPNNLTVVTSANSWAEASNTFLPPSPAPNWENEDMEARVSCPQKSLSSTAIGGFHGCFWRWRSASRAYLTEGRPCLLPLILTEMNPTRCHHSIPLKIQLSVDTDIEKVPPVEFKEIIPLQSDLCLRRHLIPQSIYYCGKEREKHFFVFLSHPAYYPVTMWFCDEKSHS